MSAHSVNLTKLCRVCGQQLINDTYFVNKLIQRLTDIFLYTTQIASYTSTKNLPKVLFYTYKYGEHMVVHLFQNYSAAS